MRIANACHPRRRPKKVGDFSQGFSIWQKVLENRRSIGFGNHIFDWVGGGVPLFYFLF